MLLINLLFSLKFHFPFNFRHPCFRHVPDWSGIDVVTRLLWFSNVRRLLSVSAIALHCPLSDCLHILGLWNRHVSNAFNKSFLLTADHDRYLTLGV